MEVGVSYLSRRLGSIRRSHVIVGRGMARCGRCLLRRRQSGPVRTDISSVRSQPRHGPTQPQGGQIHGNPGHRRRNLSARHRRYGSKWRARNASNVRPSDSQARRQLYDFTPFPQKPRPIGPSEIVDHLVGSANRLSAACLDSARLPPSKRRRTFYEDLASAFSSEATSFEKSIGFATTSVMPAATYSCVW